MKIEVELELPELYKDHEMTGEFRYPLKGEKGITSSGRVIEADRDWTETKLFILRKKRWEPKEGEEYYHVHGDKVVTGNRWGSWSNDYYRTSGFKTREDAEKALLAVREALRKTREELGY